MSCVIQARRYHLESSWDLLLPRWRYDQMFTHMVHVFYRLTARLCSSHQFCTILEICHPSHGACYHQSYKRCTPTGAGWWFSLVLHTSVQLLFLLRVAIQDQFLNTAFEGIGRGEATVFSREHVENYSKHGDYFYNGFTVSYCS